MHEIKSICIVGRLKFLNVMTSFWSIEKKERKKEVLILASFNWLSHHVRLPFNRLLGFWLKVWLFCGLAISLNCVMWCSSLCHFMCALCRLTVYRYLFNFLQWCFWLFMLLSFDADNHNALAVASLWGPVVAVSCDSCFSWILQLLQYLFNLIF